MDEKKVGDCNLVPKFIWGHGFPGCHPPQICRIGGSNN